MWKTTWNEFRKRFMLLFALSRERTCSMLLTHSSPAKNVRHFGDLFIFAGTVLVPENSEMKEEFNRR